MAPFLALLTCASVSHSVSSTGISSWLLSLAVLSSQDEYRALMGMFCTTVCQKTLSDFRPDLRISSPTASVCFPDDFMRERSSQGGRQEEDLGSGAG